MKWSVNSIEHLVPWHRASVHVCSFSPILNLCFADCSRWHWPFGYIRCLCIGQHRGCVFIQFHNWKPPGLLSVSSLNAMNGLKWNPLILSFHIHGNVWIYGPPVNVRRECGELSNSAKQQLWPNVCVSKCELCNISSSWWCHEDKHAYIYTHQQHLSNSIQLSIKTLKGKLK